MKKVVRLNENELKNMIMESVKMVLRESEMDGGKNSIKQLMLMVRVFMEKYNLTCNNIEAAKTFRGYDSPDYYTPCFKFIYPVDNLITWRDKGYFKNETIFFTDNTKQEVMQWMVKDGFSEEESMGPVTIELNPYEKTFDKCIERFKREVWGNKPLSFNVDSEYREGGATHQNIMPKNATCELSDFFPNSLFEDAYGITKVIDKIGNFDSNDFDVLRSALVR